MLKEECHYSACEKCLDFIAMNKDELKAKLQSMEKRIEHPKTKKYPEDLKLLCKYLLFCAPVVALPTRGNMVTAVQKG